MEHFQILKIMHFFGAIIAKTVQASYELFYCLLK